MSKLACPKCGGPVHSYWTCHTWPRTQEDGTQRWMSCLPCDSAVRYYCIAHSDECQSDCWDYEDHVGCGWDWTKGLNPNNPRAEENEANNPHWGES